jgi:hypothetical protein
MRRHLAFASTFALLLVLAPALDAAGAGQQARRQTGPRNRPADQVREVIWRDPGAVERLDFVGGPGGRNGAPRPPFTFLREDDDGTNPKVDVRDAAGRTWRIKWGSEVNAETFATRMIWAVGYFAEPSYFVPSGTIRNVGELKRAKDFVGRDGSFRDGRFELRVETIEKRDDEQSWHWEQNPFVRTPQLNGLKIMVMLLSNWDNKDVRDVGRGSNTAVYVVRGPRGGLQAQYLITDWGGSMGKWGNFFKREKWDPKGFADQSNELVEVDHDGLEWGYRGQHSDDFRSTISPRDVQWLLRYLGRITDRQIRDGLRASGATPDEVEIFTRSLRTRINLLRSIR